MRQQPETQEQHTPPETINEAERHDDESPKQDCRPHIRGMDDTEL